MYSSKETRYDSMKYNRCGKSGLKLPAISIGLWHNFGHIDSYENMKEILFTCFDVGINHFDVANNYGPPPGSAEENLGRILKQELKQYRDELIISTKAGYLMWPGPYGDWGSRKYMLASLDQSLKRLGVDYVDIFYSHRPDTETPLEETMLALDSAVRQGKALYVGISNYTREQTEKAYEILKQMGTPFVIHQPRYSMFDRWIEEGGLKAFANEKGIGLIAFSPLAQGLLTNRYLKGIPVDSRAGKHKSPFLKESSITEDKLKKIESLNNIALERGQSLAQMALAWVLRNELVTSVLIGASKKEQVIENAKVIERLDFSDQELKMIDEITL